MTIHDGLRVTFDPHLPKGVEWMSLSNLRLVGRRHDRTVGDRVPDEL